MMFNMHMVRSTQIWIFICFLFAGCNVEKGESGIFTILEENFDKKGKWILTSHNNPGFDGQDYAEAYIANGYLIMTTSQEYGCPEAGAELNVENAEWDDECLGWTIYIEIQTSEINAMGKVDVNIKSAGNEIVLNVYDVFSSSLLDDRLFTVDFSAEDKCISIYSNENSRTIEDVSFLKHIDSIEIAVNACGADGFSYANVELDSIRIDVKR
jgi:hypothetical protein